MTDFEPKFNPEANSEKIQEDFERARKDLREELDLELSNIELFGLKKITEEVLKDKAKHIEFVKNTSVRHDNSDFHVPYEIIARFLAKYYEIYNYYDGLRDSKKLKEELRLKQAWHRNDV